MENRKLSVLILVALVASGFFFAPFAYAYWDGTHEYLTSEAVNLYNKTAGDNAIANDLRQYLYDGAKAEDSDPRYLNHFYDPINNDGVIGGESSKKWASDRVGQWSMLFLSLPKTGLSATAYKKIKQFYPTGDFTWRAALEYWIRGDKEMAMEALGHTLHLVEDLGVPEHTRNDPHGNASEYEKYANRYSLANPDKNFAFRLGDKKQIELDSLGAYFDALARYSNRYFYSPDSIGLSGGYEFPEPDYRTAEIKDDRKYYIKNTDDEGQQYYLAAYNTIADIMTPYGWDVFLDKPAVKQSYWNLLSVRTVRTGAGVIDLFFRDVEKAKNDPNFLKEGSMAAGITERVSGVAGGVWNGVRNGAAKVGSFLGSAFKMVGQGIASSVKLVGGLFAGNNGLSDVSTVPAGDPEGLSVKNESVSKVRATPTVSAAKKEALAKKNDEITALKMQIEGLKKDAKLQDEAVLALEKKQKDLSAKHDKTETGQATSTEVRKDAAKTKTVDVVAPACAFASDSGNSRHDIIINEVAWMGGVRSASDEWVELKNISGSDVDVSGWQLLNKGGVKVHLSDLKNRVIKPGQFVLLERTDDNSAAGAAADLIYSGALGNANDGLRLFDASCGIADEIPVAAHWPAGNKDSKQTMERDANGHGWHTSSSAAGTPRRENSEGAAPVSGGGGSVATTRSGNDSSTSRQTQNEANSGRGGDVLTSTVYPKLLINKVRLASASSTHDEFVELYNPNDVAADLTGWYVQKKTKTASDFSTFAKADLFAGKRIAAHGVFVIAHPSSTVAYDIASDYGIAIDNTLIVRDPNGDIVDKVGWGAAGDCEGLCAPNPEDGQYIIRKYEHDTFVDTDDNGRDFLTSALQTPLLVIDSGAPAADTVFDATSTVLWDGGIQSGTVHELPTVGFLGQRVNFSGEVYIDTIKFGYYNDIASGMAEIEIVSADGSSTAWTDKVPVPRISYGGYVDHVLSQPLRLAAGDYFVGSRLIAGAIGIRKGYGSNPCGKDVHTGGAIPACVAGDDVSMEIVGRSASRIATTTIVIPPTSATSTDAGTTTATTTPQFYPIVINEIMYDLPGADEGREWIELYNTGTTTVDIAEWKLYEDQTHHNLIVRQGTSTLQSGQYVIIAASSTKFLEDNPGFTGTIFGSAFSLSNDGEPLALKNGDLVIHAITYASSTGANGDGKTLQWFADGWHAASSTPGMDNVLPVVIVAPETSTSTVITVDSTASTTVATSTVLVATSTVILAQYDDSVQSSVNRTDDFYQQFVLDAPALVRSFRVAVQGIAGRWRGGICAFDRDHIRCATGGLRQYTDADVDVVDSNVKTALTFSFPAEIPLSQGTNYALFVEPTPSVWFPTRYASVYGSASDVYAGGALYGYGQDISGINGLLYPGIADMYFEIR